MTTKPQRYFWVVLLAFLVACGKQTIALPTETPTPTAISPTPIPTSTLIPATDIPTPLPMQPTVAIFTPDPIQVERWREYEDALAMKIREKEASVGKVLCEWDILGRSDHEVYVWVVCMGTFLVGDINPIFPVSSVPAVIHLNEDGSVQSVEVPGTGTYDYSRMFPTDVQEKFEHYNFGRAREMSKHLDWRQEHLEEPPLIVLSATPMP